MANTPSARRMPPAVASVPSLDSDPRSSFVSMVTPAAIAVRLSGRPRTAILLSVGLAVLFTWAGLGISYYSPHPVSFFITTLAFAGYLAVRGWGYIAAQLV